jgi:hypothetical protein
MPGSVVQIVKTFTGTGSSITSTAATYGGPVLVIFALAANEAVSISDTLGSAYSAVGAPIVAANGETMFTFFSPSVVGTTQITMTFAIGPGYPGMAAIELSGITPTVTVNHGNTQVNPGTAANAITSGNVTPTATPTFLVGYTLDLGLSGSHNAGTGWTQNGTCFPAGQPYDSGVIESRSVSSLTPLSATFTSPGSGNNTWLTGVVGWVESGGGGGGGASFGAVATQYVTA